MKAGGMHHLKKRKTTEDYLKTIYLLSAKGEVRGVDKETAVNDACEMEHAVSKESFEALKRVFGICEFQFVSLAGVLAGL